MVTLINGIIDVALPWWIASFVSVLYRIYLHSHTEDFTTTIYLIGSLERAFRVASAPVSSVV